MHLLGSDYPLHALLVDNAGMLQGPSDPEKVFDRTSNLDNTQIINYRVDAQEKWCVLIGIAPGAPERCDCN